MAIALDGVAFGLQLALLGVGLTLIYGLGGVLNLAHGQLVVLAAITAAWSLDRGLGALPAVGAGVVVAAVAALLMDATLMRPVYRLHGEARVLLSLLLTLGVAFAIDGVMVTMHPFTLLSLTVSSPSVELFGVTVRGGSALASLIAATALLGLTIVLRSTRAGAAIRSVIQDEEGAQLCGIDPARVRTTVFVLSGAIAGLVAITQGLTSSVGATSGFDLTILALIVTVVGGLGRVPGALAAGLLLGVVHALASFYVGAFFTSVILLGVAVAVIVVRPSGVLGTATR